MLSYITFMDMLQDAQLDYDHAMQYSQRYDKKSLRGAHGSEIGFSPRSY